MARIIQLSDLHLTAREDKRAWRAPVWASFRRALELIQELAAADGIPIERLILTGDLANQSRPETYERMRTALEPFFDRVLAIPGNHDERELFRSVFATRLTESPAANFLDEVAGLRLIGLDSLRSGRVSGKLGKAQLAWLQETLAGSPLPSMLFIHHPPMRIGTWWLDKDLLRDLEGLRRALRGHDVRAIICGHVHQECEGTLDGVPLFSTPSTAYQFPPRAWRPHAVQKGQPGLRVIDLEAGGFETRVIWG